MKPNLRRWLYVIGAVVLVVVLTSPRVRKVLPFGRSEILPVSKDSRLPVIVYVVRPTPITDRIFSTGTILANEEVDLRSEISGKVSAIYFREGSRVVKGDLLLKIDDSELQAQLAKLNSQLKLAEDKERRRRQLLEKGNISSEDYDVVLNELNAMKAEVQLIQARLEKTSIRAPFDGVIGLRFVSEGSYVSPSTRIASLQNVSSVKLDFSVPERYARELRKDVPITFTLSGAPEKFPGSVYAIEPKIDPATRTVLLRARCPNREGKIMAGAFAQIEIVLREIPDALMIPTEALVPDLQGQKVYVVRGGVAEERRVDTGLRTESFIQVTSGLSASDSLITTGILQLAAGMPINVTAIRTQ